MSIKVLRYKRHTIWGNEASPQLYYLKPDPGSFRVQTLETIARDIELIGSMSTDDIVHVMRAFTRRLRLALTEGDKVKIDGLGTFFMTFNCTGSEEEKDCTVRNIRKVNIRFKPDNTLRLANDSTATTRNADNNVKFQIKGEAAETSNNTNPGGGDNPGGGGDDWEDPSA